MQGKGKLTIKVLECLENTRKYLQCYSLSHQTLAHIHTAKDTHQEWTNSYINKVGRNWIWVSTIMYDTTNSDVWNLITWPSYKKHVILNSESIKAFSMTLRHEKTYPSSERKQSVTEEKVIDVKRLGFLFNVIISSCVGGIFSTGLLVTSSVLGWASVFCWWWTVQFTICRAFPSHWNKWKLST